MEIDWKRIKGSIVTIGEDKHPADEIGLALSRASGILSSIANCYDQSRAEFATGSSFVAEAVSAAEDIISKAHSSLARLYNGYSLQALDEQDLVVQLPLQAAEAQDIRNDFENSPVDVQELSEHTAALSNKLENILSAMPVGPSFAAIDQPARTYDELLYKLTTMTNAASQAHGTQENLLPVLESIRADMLRIRTVA
jgi:hypothetical protein